MRRVIIVLFLLVSFIGASALIENLSAQVVVEQPVVEQTYLTVPPVDTTYLADNVILFRFFEAHGQVRRAISVVKKRSGKHEATIRELEVDEHGIHIGEPLSEFQGVLTGVPTFVGKPGDLMSKAGQHAK